MKRCPSCNYDNAQANQYCERCGTALSNPGADSLSDPTYAITREAYPTPTTIQEHDRGFIPPPPPAEQRQSFYQTPLSVPPPPPMMYASNPAPGYSYGVSSTNELRKRSISAAILSSILYLLGVFGIVFGIVGFLLHGRSTTITSFAFIIISMLGIIVLVALLIFRKYLYLKSWVRILIVVGLTFLGILALFISAAINSPGISYPAFGLIFIVYGFITAAVAFW